MSYAHLVPGLKLSPGLSGRRPSMRWCFLLPFCLYVPKKKFTKITRFNGACSFQLFCFWGEGCYGAQWGLQGALVYDRAYFRF